jgi:hypothetical protein
VSKGPTVWLTESIAESVYDEVTALSKSFRSLRAEEGGEHTIQECIIKHIKAAQPNPLAAVPEFCRETWKAMIDKVGAVKRKGGTKPLSRQETMCIRTPLSFASILHSLFNHGLLSYELFIQLDDLSLLIHPSMDQKPSLMTTAEAIAWLNKSALSVPMTKGGNLIDYICLPLFFFLRFRATTCDLVCRFYLAVPIYI